MYVNLVELEALMLHAKFQDPRPFGSGKKIFEGFCYLYPWLPSWSCDLDHLYKHSFPLPKLHMKFGFD